MSRKRKQSKRAAPAAAPAPGEAVPDEILAEGSGPVEPASAAELAEAANAVGRRRRKRRGPEPEAEASTDAAAAGQSDEVSNEGEPGGAAAEVAGAAAEAELAVAEEDPAADAEVAAEVEASAADADGAAEMHDALGREGGALADEACVTETSEMAEALAEMAAGDGAAGAEPAGDAADGDAADGDVTDGEADVEADGAELGAVLPTSAASMDAAQLKHLVEALVFASDKPLTIARLRQLTRVSDTRRLEQALESIAGDFAERGIVLQQVSGGYQFRTRTQFSGWVQQLIAGRPVRLSRAQLETLAIIAYRQPITRPEIDDIRGVDSSATLKLLIDRALIRILGKKEEVGRPMLYGTTKEFLDFFSLGDLRELPTLREYSELTDESRQVMSARLGIELDESARGAGEGKPEEDEPGAEGADGPTAPGADDINGERHVAAEASEGEGGAAEAEAAEHEAAAIEAAEGEVAEGEAAEEIEAAGGEAAEVYSAEGQAGEVEAAGSETGSDTGEIEAVSDLDLDPELRPDMRPDMGPDIASHVGAIAVEGQLDAEGAVEPAPE